MTDITFTVAKADLASRSRPSTDEVAGDRRQRGRPRRPSIAKVSIVGLGMRSHAGVATRMFSALRRGGINIQMISTSEIAISVVIDEKYTELAVRALHETFGLAAA